MHRQNEKIWNKTSVLIPNTPIFDGFKVREWLYEACWYFSWYWRVFIACKLWELNRGVQKAFREQNHLRLHTRLTSEKQLFICLFPHLFSTFHIEIWCWRAAWTRGKQMSLPHREEFDMNCIQTYEGLWNDSIRIYYTILCLVQFEILVCYLYCQGMTMYRIS